MARGPYPAGHTTDAHQIRHVQIRRPGLYRLEEPARPVDVLSNLNRRLKLELAGQLGRLSVVVEDDRFLKPVKSLLVQSEAPRDGFVQRKPLVEIAHQLDFRPDGATHGFKRLDVLSQARAAKPDLDRAEVVFRHQLFRFFRQPLQRQKPDTVGVVGS
jgi:hypothetical protein